MGVACCGKHTVRQMTQREGNGDLCFDVTTQTMEVSAVAHFDFG